MAMWIITDDVIDGGAENGVRTHNQMTEEEVIEKCPYQFRMLDDDGEIYYYGYSNDCDSEEAFEPLDYFGMPNAGCTEIQYFNEERKRWETL